MKKMLGIALALCCGFAFAGGALKLDNKYFKATLLEACFYAAAAEGGGNVWLPQITYKIMPKTTIDIFELSGTFVDLKDGSSLGRDTDSESDLESGIYYTMKIHSSQGWNRPVDHKMKITPKIELYIRDSNLYGEKFTLPDVNKFKTVECKY